MRAIGEQCITIARIEELKVCKKTGTFPDTYDWQAVGGAGYWAASGNNIYNTNSAGVNIGIVNPDPNWAFAVTKNETTAGIIENNSTAGIAYFGVKVGTVRLGLRSFVDLPGAIYNEIEASNKLRFSGPGSVLRKEFFLTGLAKLNLRERIKR